MQNQSEAKISKKKTKYRIVKTNNQHGIEIPVTYECNMLTEKGKPSKSNKIKP